MQPTSTHGDVTSALVMRFPAREAADDGRSSGPSYSKHSAAALCALVICHSWASLGSSS